MEDNEVKEKPSFLVYKDRAIFFDEATDSEAAALIRAIFHYATEGTMPELESPLMKAGFKVMKGDIDRDTEKYIATCERNRISGKMGGLAKASNRKQALAESTEDKRSLPNLADKDKDKEKETDKEKDKDIISQWRQDFDVTFQNYPKIINMEEAFEVYCEWRAGREVNGKTYRLNKKQIEVMIQKYLENIGEVDKSKIKSPLNILQKIMDYYSHGVELYGRPPTEEELTKWIEYNRTASKNEIEEFLAFLKENPDIKVNDVYVGHKYFDCWQEGYSSEAIYKNGDTWEISAEYLEAFNKIEG